MKGYIEKHYHMAVQNFELARTEDEQWEARKEMSRLEQLASVLYGFDYVDQLHQNNLSQFETQEETNKEKICGD